MPQVSSDETERLIKMEETLHQRVIGQEEAVVAISRAIRRARVGLKNPNRPIASFIFSGPTGVGKSELAKTLASYYFGSEDAMVRLDMSEFMERHTVSKLIGSPPGMSSSDFNGAHSNSLFLRPAWQKSRGLVHFLAPGRRDLSHCRRAEKVICTTTRHPTNTCM